MKRLRVLSFVSVAALMAGMACSAPPKGGLVLAISTDMQTPKDVDVVSVFITIDSVVKFDYLGRVLPDGTVELPATLAIVEQSNPNAQVRIRVIAFKEQTSRVLRDVLTTIPHEQTSLLRVPLNFLDDGSGAGTLPANLVPLAPGGGGAPEGDTSFDPDMIASSCDFSKEQTSINGVCATARVDSSVLPAYDPTEVYGAGGVNGNGAPASCFDVQTCFAQATPVLGLDTAKCQFSLSANMAGADASTAVTPDASTGTGDIVGARDAGAPPAAVEAGLPVVDGADASAPLTLPAAQGSPSVSDPLPLNLALVTPSTGACTAPGRCFVPLENNVGEGWTISGDTVSLLPGICQKVKAGAALYMEQGACPSKQLSDVVCEPTTDMGTGSTGGAVDASVANSPDAGSTMSTLGDSGVIGADDGGVNAITCGSILCETGEVCCAPIGADSLTCATPKVCQSSGMGDASAAFDSGAPPATDGGVTTCVPLTCPELGFNCGYSTDGCGGVLQCGACTDPQFCGGGGFNLCGGSVDPDGGTDAGACVPATCASEGIQCGPIGDGCGNLLPSCGMCPAGQTCGGAGPGTCG